MLISGSFRAFSGAYYPDFSDNIIMILEILNFIIYLKFLVKINFQSLIIMD